MIICKRKLGATDAASNAGRGGYFAASFSAAVSIATVALIAVAMPVHAQDFSDYFQLGAPQTTAGSSSTYDREFVREWEANPPKGFATLSKANIEPTKAAIQRYAGVVAQGGWPVIPEVQLESGMTDGAVPLLRSRLNMSGDLAGDDNSAYFGLDLEKAVMRFQASNGLTPTGIVDKRTVAALNVPADARLKQLKTNLGRLQELSGATSKRYVAVNIPAAQIETVENGVIVARYAGVVGKPDRPTPLLRSSVTDLNFNPIWTLPPTVIEKDLIPKGRDMQNAGKNVLVKYGIDAYDGGGKKLDPEKINWSSAAPAGLSYRQQPGKDNPLGFLKINFDNAHSVYMHDTPSENVFGRNFRAASSGCIRVQNIDHLAAWILSGQNGWTREKVAGMKELGTRLDVRVKKPVQLLFVYLTAWATEDGVVQFRRDIYQRDGIGAVASAY